MKRKGKRASEDRYGRIVNLTFVFQRIARPGDEGHVKITGFRQARVKMATWEEDFAVDIPIGPGEFGSIVMRHVILRYVNKYGDRDKYETFYVVAEFETSDGGQYFRTVTPRTQLPAVKIRTKRGKK